MFNEKLYFENLTSKTIGRNLKYFETINSTNSFIMNEGWAEGVIAIAETQVSGKGRTGKTWASLSGGAFFSFALTNFDKKLLMPLNVVVGFAVTDVLRKFVPAGLKWPNDCVCGGKKICGILFETQFEGDRLEKLAVGIGINLFKECVPDDLAIPAVSLETLGVPKISLSKEKIIAEVINRVEFLLNQLINGILEIDKLWSCYSANLNDEITVAVNGKKQKYIETGIDKFGFLLCLDEYGVQVTITAGEIGYDFSC